ncbi:MAG: hypothetical protein AB1344_02730 [Pseudomonadota bacterium]
MMKRTLIAAALALSTLPVMAGDMQKPLNLGEHLALRSYTGQAIGSVFTNVLKVESAGFAVNTSSICSTLTGAAAGEVVAHNRNTGAMMIGAFGKPEEAAAAFAQLKGKQAIGLMFGGQTPPEENAALVKALLGEMAKADYQGPVFLHLAVWAGKMAEMAAAEDAAIAKYLAGKDNVYALTVDKEKGKGLVHNVSFKDGKQASVKVVHEAAMNDSWLELFKRSQIKRQ